MIRSDESDHALVPVKQLYLPHPEHFNPRSAPRLDPTTDTNPLIFEGLRGNAGRLERPVRALK